MLAVVLTLGAMPVYGTFASAGTDEPTVETTDETPTSSVEPTTPEPAAAPAPQGEPEATLTPSAEVTPSGEPEASSTQGETPTESPEPENTTYANSISGVLWVDANENGVYDSREQPLADYLVYLYVEGDTDNAVQTATTDAGGKYRFDDISPGRYVVGIKAEENGTEYLLPLMGVQQDNKFYFTPDYSKVISNAINIAADTVVTGIDAAMRNRPGIQPMANATYTININSPVITGIPGVTYASNILTFTTSVDPTDTYIITGTGAATANRIVVNDGVGTALAPLNITLSEVRISNSVSPFRLLGTANVNLTLDGTNVLTCTGTSTTVGTYQAGLYVSPSAALTIGGTGALQATGGTYCAGIGSSYLSSTSAINNSGTISINSGTVTANSVSSTGTTSGPGIGSGFNSDGGTININGGTVTATAGGTGPGGAGIGGAGGSLWGGAINISGGTVTANGGNGTNGGAGIGGGSGGSGGTINISGGMITATGGGTTRGGTGIGGGSQGSSGTINISDGTIAATGGGTAIGYGSAGIGAGSNASTNGTITISGGMVTAKSSLTTSPGIGSCSKTSNIGTVIFIGGSIYPTDSAGTVSVYPTPTNGTYGNDPVGIFTFTQFAGQDFSIMTAGSAGIAYAYKGVGHTAAAYPWLSYPGVITDAATAMSTTAASVTAPSTVNSVASSTATLNGTYYLNNTYPVTSAYFEWGTTTTYGTTMDMTSSVNTSEITTAVRSLSSPALTGLTPGTTYHYRLVIVTNSITVRGNDVTFTTPVLAPSVDVTHTVTSGTAATLYGIYDLNGDTFVSGLFEISSDNGATWSTPTGGTLTGASATSSVNLTGLTTGATYEYRFTVTNSEGANSAMGSFTVGFAVTEKFVNLSGSAVDSIGLPENTVNVASSYTASGIPTSHTVGGNTYTYIGYKLDSYTTGDTLISGTPSSVTVTGNRDVYYIYAIAQGSIKIEKYANDGTTLLPGAEFKLEKLTGPGGTIDTTFTAQTLATGVGGNVTFVNLPAGSYRITETKAPAGYELLTAAFEVDIPKDITYAVGTPPADNSYLYSATSGSNVVYHYYDVTYKVSDQASIAMPSAGAMGNFPPYALWGSGLILLAALCGGILWTKRRRAYAPKHG